ncbi:MAG: cob(I)yrinic acid a,c-diamide adenosyltransferase [Alphaproteobacteria bacterium]|nr:cob(I)yrinic acid a,c-diamide adenosyltransferase [Alphaproteobacteria bacterium]
MVRLTRIYTRGGDTGMTSLGDGTRVAKHDARIAAIGSVEEANAALGVVRLHTRPLPDIDAMLARIQNELFDLGADLCTPGEDFASAERLRVVPAQVKRLEEEIDAMNEGLAPLTSFVLPGGSPAAAHLHLARTVVRRAERDIAALMAAEAVNPAALQYANRLSDHLFVLGRILNAAAGGDVLWQPGGTRP